MKLRAWLLLLLAYTWPLLRASAHPVAQGSLEIRLEPSEITLHARVSVEEVFVETSLGRRSAPASDLAHLWPAHGEYFLRHFFVEADGALLTGEIGGIDSPAVPTADHFVTYTLRYPLPLGRGAPARLQVRENLLNEFEFAPGNVWEATFVTRFEQRGQPAREALLLTARAPLQIEVQPAAGAAAPAEGFERRRLWADYLRHGIMHILEGWDHLLFMAALVLAAVTFVDLLKVVTAFTLAHTITLTLSVLDVVRVSSRIVEPMIAASIVFVAVQNVFWPSRTRGWGRLAVAFGFGLFHGLGFAGGLLEAMQGLPGVAVGIAIAAFSLGVEIGHQAVVLPVFFGLRLARAASADSAGRGRISLLAMRYGSVAISLAGTFYLVAALRS